MVVWRCLGSMVVNGAKQRIVVEGGEECALKDRMHNEQGSSGETRSWWAVTAFSQRGWYPRYPVSVDWQNDGHERRAGFALRGQIRV